MNIEINICGHCGTEVRGGYTVCPGCGAVYTRRVGRAVRGIVCVVVGFPAAVLALVYLVSGYTYSSGSELGGMAVLLVGIALVYAGIKHFRDGWRKAWWRTS